jgi:hypothetical protein
MVGLLYVLLGKLEVRLLLAVGSIRHDFLIFPIRLGRQHHPPTNQTPSQYIYRSEEELKNESKTRQTALTATPTRNPRPKRHRKTQHSKRNNLDEKGSLRSNNHQKSGQRTETLGSKLQHIQPSGSEAVHS